MQLKAVHRLTISRFLWIDCIHYTVCHQKNRRRLEQCASEIGAEVNKIGKILDVRWVASSFRAVKAVWNSYPVLHSHFCKSACDPDIGSKARAEYSGLTKQLASSTISSQFGIDV